MVKIDQLTLSCSIATYPDHGTDGQTLLQATGQALNQAKGQGRNRSEQAVSSDQP